MAAILPRGGTADPHPDRSRRPRRRLGLDAQTLGAERRDPRGRRRRPLDGGGRGARADRRAAALAGAPAEGHPRGGQSGAAGVRVHRVAVRRRRPGGAHAERRVRGHRSRGGADRALLEQHRAGTGGFGDDHRGGPGGAPLRRLGARLRLPAGGVPAALPGLRAGVVADRRRRGAAVPPVRARALDARGRAGTSDGGGDGGTGAGPAATGLTADGLRAPALPPALRGAGRGRPHGGGAGGERHRERARARGDRVRGPGRLYALHRGGGRGGGAVAGRALRRGCDQHAARRRPRGEDDRRRGDGGRQRRPGAGGLGRRLRRPVRGAPRAAHRDPLGNHAVPRRRLLRPRHQPGLAGRRARPRRRGARDRLGARGGAGRVASGVREHRPGEAEGVRPAAPALPRRAARVVSVLEAARPFVVAGSPLLVLVSGGGDSVALLDVAVRLDARVSVLHVNYGLREGADADEELVRSLCSRLGVPLFAESVDISASAAGNLQERARDARYALAERLAEGDYAAAHTASDQAETVLYRLAVSPGSRALQGMAPRRGRLVRPLLAVTREEVRDYLRARRLEWRQDPSNADRRFARARVRHDVLDALRELSPAVERTIAETARQLRDEAEVLDAVVGDALAELGGGPAISVSALLEQPPAVQRLVLRALAERAGAPGSGPRDDERGEASARQSRPLSRREADEILALGGRGAKSLDLGGGLRAVAEYGTLRFTRLGEAAVPDAVALRVPGRVRFGDWEVEARVGGPGDVTVSELGPELTVRAWRDGDRMRPAGLGGSKSLQDLFTDRKVPRGLRRTLPVVEADGEIVWVAGVAVGERFAAAEGEPGAVGLSARSAGG